MMSHVRTTWSLLRSCSGVCRRPISSGGGGGGAGGGGGGGGIGGVGGESLILVSRSTDVFVNLALEDWIQAHVDLESRRVFLLWRNSPSVVIGRHQNPWAECNLAALRGAGLPVARRRSGGGTVYHDLGNLNMTFFTSRRAYDRRRNLQVVTDALQGARPNLNVQITERLDIVLNGRLKISGSASRLSRKSSYHHCTLLHSADRSSLSSMLRPSCPGIHSNATPSVRSPVANLLDHAPSLQWAELLEALIRQYNKEFGSRAVSTPVDPGDEAAFPGLGEAAEELRSWDWTFGRTPKFSIRTRLDLRDGATAGLDMEVKAGVIESCRLDVPSDWIPGRLSGELSAVLVGGRFCPHRAAAAASQLLRSERSEHHTRLEDLRDAVLTAMG